MNTKVIVVVGVGGIGMAIARREGAGKIIVLADINEKALEESSKSLDSTGYIVKTKQVDVSSQFSVQSLVKFADELGDITQVVNTAGLSPNMASADKILAVDLLGTALILEEFGKVISQGGSGIIISSMAGHMYPPLEKEFEEALIHTPANDLMKLSFLESSKITDSGYAYGVSKRANHLRVQAESIKWGERGGRINSISPGIIMTPLAQHELNSEIGHLYQKMIEGSVSKRVGTADEVANLAHYLLNEESSFMTGSDILIDGGVISAMRLGKIALG